MCAWYHGAEQTPETAGLFRCTQAKGQQAWVYSADCSDPERPTPSAQLSTLAPAGYS
jgi:hypothetical protein